MMTEHARMHDFIAVNRYHLVSKINHAITRGKIQSYADVYTACANWHEWRNRRTSYSKSLYASLDVYNACSLSTNQIKAIFGKTISASGKRVNLPYKRILAESGMIIGTHGERANAEKPDAEGKTQMERGKGFFCKTYLLPENEIAAVFADGDLLAKVLDWNSEIYTPRQRRLIQNQIIRNEKGVAVIQQKKREAAKAKASRKQSTSTKETKDMRQATATKPTQAPTQDEDMPQQPQQSKSKVLPRLQEFVERHLISAEHATAISAFYGTPKTYKETRERFCMQDLDTPEKRRQRATVLRMFYAENCKRTDLTDKQLRMLNNTAIDIRHLTGGVQ